MILHSREFDSRVFVPDDCPYYEVYVKDSDRRRLAVALLDSDDN